MSLEIRPAHRADASAVNELLDQLGYPQVSQTATANRIQTWAEDPSSAAYVAEAGTVALVVSKLHTRSTEGADTSIKQGCRPGSGGNCPPEQGLAQVRARAAAVTGGAGRGSRTRRRGR
jgi:hypothetical protein